MRKPRRSRRVSGPSENYRTHKRENSTVFGKSQREVAAEDAVDAARDHEQALREQNEEIKKTLDLMKQIRKVESDIAKNRELLAAGELPEIVTTTRARSIAPDDTRAAFRDLIPDEPIEIPLAIPEDAEKVIRSEGEKAARAAQDAMTKFTDDVPAKFEDNMERAFYAVQDMGRCVRR